MSVRFLVALFFIPLQVVSVIRVDDDIVPEHTRHDPAQEDASCDKKHLAVADDDKDEKLLQLPRRIIATPDPMQSLVQAVVNLEPAANLRIDKLLRQTPSASVIMASCVVFLFIVACAVLATCYGRRLFAKEVDLGDEEDEADGDIPTARLGHWKHLRWVSQQDAASLESKEDKSLNVDVSLLQLEWTPAMVKRTLHSNGVDTKNWSEEAFGNMARELSLGKAQLLKGGRKLVRSIDQAVVLVAVQGLVLQVESDVAHRRDFGEMLEKTIKTRVFHTESIFESTRRCLMDRLGCDESYFKDLTILRLTKNWETHDHMPGLSTMVRKYVVKCHVATTDAAVLEQLGVAARRVQVANRSFVWTEIRDATWLREYANSLLNLNAAAEVETYSEMLSKEGFEDCMNPVLAWDEENLMACLRKFGSEDSSAVFGKTLAQLIDLLSQGRLALGATSDGDLYTVVEFVQMAIKSADGMLLVNDDLWCLPYVQKFPTESAFTAGSRLSHELLGLSTHFNIEEQDITAREFSAELLAVMNLFPDGLPSKCVRRVVRTKGNIGIDYARSFGSRNQAKNRLSFKVQ